MREMWRKEETGWGGGKGRREKREEWCLGATVFVCLVSPVPPRAKALMQFANAHQTSTSLPRSTAPFASHNYQTACMPESPLCMLLGQ